MSTARDRRHAIAFVAAALLLLGIVFGLLGGLRLARPDHTYFVAVPDSIAGLRPGSTVEYKGVPVGLVRAISFRGGSVEAVQVEVAIRRGVPIKTDTKATLRPQGITGLNILELTGGTSAAPDLPEQGVIPIEPSFLTELETTAHDVATLVRRLGATTAAIESEAAPAIADLRAGLVAFRGAARALEATTGVIGSDVAASAQAFNMTAGDLHGILADPAWRSLGGEVLAAVQEIRRTVEKLERVAHEVEGSAGENRADVRAAVENLKRATGDLRIAARRVRESPASLVVEHPPVEKPIPDPTPPGEGSRP
ncbi:MAG TPA: MlaD family protein [Planctomycetota bacterium]|nr:MlaD family protein [Planctomycetota bacterium]